MQNLMSEHEYYHAAGMNLEEVDALWVSPTGENAKTACFFSPGWVMQGVATVRKNYGEGHQSDKEKAFEELKKAYPELAGMDAKTSNIGGEFAMHTSTTPVIEVARDGKTAKGIWYSPGMGLTPHVAELASGGQHVLLGEVRRPTSSRKTASGRWHLGMYYDFVPQFPASMTERLNKGTASAEQRRRTRALPAAAGVVLRRGMAGGAPPKVAAQAGDPKAIREGRTHDPRTNRQGRHVAIPTSTRAGARTART